MEDPNQSELVNQMVAKYSDEELLRLVPPEYRHIAAEYAIGHGELKTGLAVAAYQAQNDFSSSPEVARQFDINQRTLERANEKMDPEAHISMDLPEYFEYLNSQGVETEDLIQTALETIWDRFSDSANGNLDKNDVRRSDGLLAVSFQTDDDSSWVDIGYHDSEGDQIIYGDQGSLRFFQQESGLTGNSSCLFYGANSPELGSTYSNFRSALDIDRFEPVIEEARQIVEREGEMVWKKTHSQKTDQNIDDSKTDETLLQLFSKDLTQKQVANQTGLSVTQVSNHVKDLKSKGLVETRGRAGTIPTEKGRRMLD